MAKEFFFLSILVIFVNLTLLWAGWTQVLWSLLLFGPLMLMGLIDFFQKSKGVRRNFPVIGNLRYFFENIRPELQQYFVESNLSGRPIPRELRSVVYQRAKGVLQTQPFGTQRDVNEENYEWVNHSMQPLDPCPEDLRVAIGGEHNGSQVYQASLLNVSAMSYGALSSAAIEALNRGALKGGFYHNTGEGGISPHHLHGGDLVWQIGTGYFGCRDREGNFCPEMFKSNAQRPEVKMIEVKLSQGAKPGKGGILPGEKVTPEVAQIRGVEVGKSVVSPSYHRAFSSPVEMLEFVARLRTLSGGKPVGLKLCVGRKSEFMALCKAMLKTGLRPDFINVDGGEGGTGAAPLEFANSVGTPLDEGLSFVHDCLVGFGLREQVQLIAGGKVLTGFHLLTKLALGADLVNSGRGMMLALGCIHALKCNTNHCPVGVATTDPTLVRGLHVPDKFQRVARYQVATLEAFREMLGAMGYSHPGQIQRQDVYRRLTDGVVKSYEQLFPSLTPGSLLQGADLPALPQDWLEAYRLSHPESFSPRPVQFQSA